MLTARSLPTTNPLQIHFQSSSNSLLTHFPSTYSPHLVCFWPTSNPLKNNFESTYKYAQISNPVRIHFDSSSNLTRFHFDNPVLINLQSTSGPLPIPPLLPNPLIWLGFAFNPISIYFQFASNALPARLGLKSTRFQSTSIRFKPALSPVPSSALPFCPLSPNPIRLILFGSTSRSRPIRFQSTFNLLRIYFKSS